AGLAAAVLGGAVLVAGALVLRRFPSAIAPLALAVAPLRLPLDVGTEHRFLVGTAEAGKLGRLHLLYLVIALGTIALALRALRREPLPSLPHAIALPAGLFLAVASLSLLWSRDVDASASRLAFFLLPLALLVAVVGRAPFAPWLPRALAGVLLALTSVFAAVGLWQAWSKELLFYAPNLEVANAYTSFFRVTSLFTDPSLYGRHLILGIAVLLVLLLRRRVPLALGAALVGFLFAGLYVSYSQSSLAALFVVGAALGLLQSGRRRRMMIAATLAVLAVGGAGSLALAAQDESARRFTSGRSRLASITVDVFERHPLAGVGLGAQPAASRALVGPGAPEPRYTSHTTPLTVAAELGLVGLAAYLGLLVGAGRALFEVWRRHPTLGLSLAAVLAALVVHSLFYSGFYEDPLTWGVLALASSFLARAPAPA
ncbi:MAG: O-antigen ligase family protein, partial [Actinobacteria bacterium]|nr:O-antigen ligase family protein [Actinomycetota bacterium]